MGSAKENLAWLKKNPIAIPSLVQEDGSIPTDITYYDSGTKTKSGERFAPLGFAAAVDPQLYPMLRGETIIVEDPASGKEVSVKVNDIGAMRKVDSRHSTLVDLTPAAFKQFAPTRQGRVRGLNFRRVEEGFKHS